MRLLLDTHVFVWWLDDAPRLSRRLRALIANTQNEVFVSAVSAFEITTKFRLGKLPAAAAFVHDLANLVERSGFRDLPLTTIHATRAGLFPNPHADPFDRLLAAQALIEQLPVASVDVALDSFMVERIA
jgi:PIN domain nuclease of toxin-antitoxin system